MSLKVTISFEKLLRYTLAIFAVAVFAAAFTPSKPAEAAPACNNNVHWTRKNCHGFYTDVLASTDKDQGGDVVISAGIENVTDANSYISTMKNFLFNGDLQEQTSSSFTMSIMMGRGPSYYGGVQANGISWAKTNFAQWESLIRWYDDHGLVDWVYIITYTTDHEDSGYSHVTKDDYYTTYGAYTSDDIRFRVPPGVTGEPFLIDRSCANIQGSDEGLAIPNPPTGDVNPPTPGGPSTPPGYNTGDSAVNSSCSVISGHAFDPNDVNYAVKVHLTYSIGGFSDVTASTAAGHAYSVTTPANVRNSITPVQVTAVGTDASNGTYNLTNSPITIGPCLLANPTCDGVTITPASIDPGTPYTITARVRYGSDLVAQTAITQPGARFFVTVTGPGVNTNLASVVPIQSDGSGGVSVTTPQQPPTGQTGTYRIGYGIVSAFGPINCGTADTNEPNPPTFPVVNKPYFSVTGGDISAGSGMSTGGVDCAVSTNPDASIVSWNRGATGGFGGAGTNYAALALNHLQEFATGQGSGLQPDGMAFANTAAGQVNVGSGLYGGKFGGLPCVADYFANATGTQNGNITVGGRAVANGTHQTIYVKGSVYITGNITFSGAYANTAQVPSFSIVVLGNIYIAPGVTQLDGFYIAQPSSAAGTDGKIYTCAPVAFTSPALNRNIQNSCNTPLTVNGSFIANQVWLLRTAGTLSTTPAETFNYVPEMWLSAPFGNNLSIKTDDYDSITSLPPVL